MSAIYHKARRSSFSSIDALTARLSTVNSHVVRIRLAFPQGCPIRTLGLQAFVRFRGKLRAVRVLVLAPAKAARMFAIEFHVRWIVGALVLLRPFRAPFVLVFTRCFDGAFGRCNGHARIPTKTTRLFAIEFHIRWIGAAFVLGCPQNALCNGTPPRF